MPDGYTGGYGSFVRDFEARVPEGTKHKGPYAAVVRDAGAGRFDVPVLADGRVGFRYGVTLGHDPAQGPGWDETPHPIDDGVVWTGKALFVLPRSAALEVSLVPPRGQHVSTSLDPDAKVEHLYSCPSVHDLQETYLLVGEHFQTTLELGGSTVLLAVDGAVAEAAELIERQVKSFVEAAIEATGGPPPARCLVAVTLSSEGGGALHGRDAHVLVRSTPEDDGPIQWRRTLCHEIFHLWNEQKVGFDSREMWFSEGFTDYYANRLLADTGTIAGATFLDIVRDWTRDYLGEAGDKGLREAGVLGSKNNTLIYKGGALAAFCIDVAIRDDSGGRRSLDDVMQALYELNADAGGNVPIAELQELLEKHGGRGLKDFLERHVAGAEPLPLDEAFARAGVAFERRRVQVPEMDAVMHLFQCPGMTGVGDGIEINRTNAGKLEAGDVVHEVAGRPVTDFGDLRRALAGRQPGDKVPVVLRRNGKRVEVETRLGGHGESLPTSEAEEVVLEPVAKAKKKARAIRAALFGELKGR